MRRQDLITAMPVLALALAGLWFTGQGAWIHAKAMLAQVLLEDAWSETLVSGEPVPPWPWADTWPVARLRVEIGEEADAETGAQANAEADTVDLIVLAGDSGRTLAFGPGHTSGSAAPGEPGTTVISGHRDTHFRFLERLRPGARLELTAPGGTTRYRVSTTRVVDSRRFGLRDPGRGKRLVLVTCWPFDAISPGGPLRYVVEAEPIVGSGDTLATPRSQAPGAS